MKQDALVEEDTLSKMDTEKVEAAAAQSSLFDFVGLLANPYTIEAIVPGPAVIDGEPVNEGDCSFVTASGRVITIMGRECAMPLYHAAKRGCIR